jgi:disulfide bond formation protein DsbB
MTHFIKKYALVCSWITAWLSTVGSLFFSEVMKLPPCVLCWYQRIAMYPLVVILLIGIWKKDAMVVWYSVPFAIIGWVIALYHNLLYYQIIPEPIGSCANGVSCTTQQIMWFGFISIPLLSFGAFSFILFCLLLVSKKTK